uniref:Uncharacterized protein n=1 Tax=Fibrocapsa japonica TaxID=94617 RepID=A0A7S2V0D7_9STRA|mmetsp:Transcript_22787/g.33060  ORF Transcript_22787/g.33060 Transcript_22787/m.33060 type:complete len:399 (+) Transcript_22787:117-1313(+)|eukprot:CAMPEP_0113942406 /NCGR_PEP_ID=MMETSP1339-20121228/8124_1 /TAXON_ID=94617 /ORGANISM="Fibrocapsa japonica" /LENGTH=398 /DNA_ID=CAMNT_0000946865 /DNA_START=42 /DNA_END=1238 /DNA_ORIENTATION=+ /assembly_acc=CAM_ASM_000762
MATSKGIFVVAAKRTPFGAFGGSLKGLSATELCVHSSKAALLAANLNPSAVDVTVVGNVIQSSLDAAYLSRHVGLKCGVDIEKPALTINRLCGSGFESVIQGGEQILLGQADVALCGGTENMSACPMVLDGITARWGVGLGLGMKLEDSLWGGLTDTHAGTPMGITAENLADKYGITREECDEYAVRSQHAWAVANKEKRFDAELAPIEIKTRKGPQAVDTDEHPREVSLEKMGNLPPVFRKDGGRVTAANASGICDGAGTIVLASEDAVKEYNLTPLARLAGWSRTGCPPEIMGIGPASAIPKALESAGVSLNQVDRVEINEAFAAQYLACEKDLGLDREKTNVNGGAIALGHPLAASGSRLTAHLTHDLKRVGGKWAVGSACIGGGQGIAVVLENC